MTIVKGKTHCDNCDKDHDVELDLNDITIEKLKTAKLKDISIEEKSDESKPDETKPEVKTEFKIPSHIPSAQCKSGKCGKNHKNKDYTNPPNQKCENCGQFSYNSKECPWCNHTEFEEIDQDTLQELEIPIPASQEEHDHDHED